jgi:pSer/pThr/pTyr-binding forkhead associated (FHA) protein
MAGAKPRDRHAVVRGVDQGARQLRPGEALRIGRHHENDIVLKDSVVSRFHATLRWDQGAERPVLYDNGSQNGTNVNGKDVIGRAEPLATSARITIGPYLLNVEVHGVSDSSPIPALLEDAPESVALFTEQGPEIKGSLDAPDATRQLFLRLECERRTGTLQLDLANGKAKVTFGVGRVMDATYQGLMGLRALDRVAQATHGSYQFTREMEPSDQAMNLWFSDFLRMKHDSYYATRQWKRPKEPGEGQD